jgi:Uma2 family endonuclease
VTLQTTRLYGPFRYEDLEDAPDDGYRREIIDGSLIVTPAPNLGHQLALANLYSILRAAATPEIMALFAPLDWRQPDGGVVEPDLLVLRRADFDIDGRFLADTATPLLLIEVLSPSRPQYDLAVKRALYERLGVPAYWIVDPRRHSVLALRLIEGAYEIEAEVTGDEEFVTDWPFPVRFRPNELGT